MHTRSIVRVGIVALPDFVMFNGAAFQYRDDPIEVPTGEEFRLFVLNVGPSIDSSFPWRPVDESSTLRP